MRGKICALIIAVVSGMAIASTAQGGDATLKVVEAWVPITDSVGSDIPLLLTIRNETDSSDALPPVRCPVANSSERHATDRGEGAPAMRAMPAIPIAAGGTTVLKPDGDHVMLLQTPRQPLANGESPKCAIDFQKAGTIETEVSIGNRP